jgi:hypothetical protein
MKQKAVKTQLNSIHAINLNTFSCEENVVKGDISFAENVKKSACVTVNRSAAD